MFGKNIKYKNFRLNFKLINKKKTLNNLKKLIKEKSELILSLDKNYIDFLSKKTLKKLKKINYVLLIGIGGSSLGAKAIYNFLRPRKKKFVFFDNFSNIQFQSDNKKD